METIIDVVRLKKLLSESEEEITNSISDKIISFIRDNYIHKADYKARLKADMIAMLTEIQTEIECLPITDTAIRLVYEILDKYKEEDENDDR